MFSFFKPKPAPEGPVVFEVETDIGCSANQLYRIVDFGDEQCWKREVGTVNKVSDREFAMELDLVPDMVFKLHILEEDPGKVYRYECVMEPRGGRLVTCTEGYAITDAGPDRCIVKLSAEAIFEDGLTFKQWQQEVEMMAMAVNNSLGKLKVHVEDGVDRIREIEKLQQI